LDALDKAIAAADLRRLTLFELTITGLGDDGPDTVLEHTVRKRRS
jgi:hypothetical protein